MKVIPLIATVVTISLSPTRVQEHAKVTYIGPSNTVLDTGPGSTIRRKGLAVGNPGKNLYFQLLLNKHHWIVSSAA